MALLVAMLNSLDDSLITTGRLLKEVVRVRVNIPAKLNQGCWFQPG